MLRRRVTCKKVLDVISKIAFFRHSVQFAATTTHLAAYDFNALSELEEPLCESVNSFLGLYDSLVWFLILPTVYEILL